MDFKASNDNVILEYQEMLSNEKSRYDMMQKTFEEKLAEERIEKENLEKTYRYATEEIQKLQDNLAQSHNENDEQTDPKILRDYCRSSSSGRLKNDFMDMKKENQALKEKNGFAERDLVLLQEEYDSIKGKLEKCAMANEKLLESNNSLKVRKKIVIILRAARNS